LRYARFATYDLLKGDFKELTKIVEEGILPLISSEPGYLNYGLVDAKHNKFVSISIWETREAAQKSATLAADWIKENMPNRVRLVTSYVGDLALFHGVPGSA